MAESMFEDLVEVLFPPGVHDIVANDLGEGFTEFVCAAGDYAGIVARTDDEGSMRMARRAALAHAAAHGRVACHEECLDEPGCLYDGETG